MKAIKHFSFCVVVVNGVNIKCPVNRHITCTNTFHSKKKRKKKTLIIVTAKTRETHL